MISPSVVVKNWSSYTDVELFIENVLDTPEDLSSLSVETKRPVDQRCGQVSEEILKQKVADTYKKIYNYLKVHETEFSREDLNSLRRLEENVTMIDVCASGGLSRSSYEKTIQLIKSLERHIKQECSVSEIQTQKENRKKELYNDENFVQLFERACLLAKNAGVPEEELSLITERTEKQCQTNPDQTVEIRQSLLGSVDNLRKLAIDASLYGYKTANLRRLAEIFPNDSTVIIPYFKAIAHDEVLACIRVSFPQFDILWKNFTAHIAQGRTIESASPILSQIQSGIKEAISSSKTFPAESDIEVFARQQKKIVVRSTGREDTLKTANPGGNESINNISPNRREIACAIGEVIASYFSIKSLGQRQATGDDITQPPFMPAVMQVMVRESKGNIPTSGVMYTTEGDLGTENVVQISASFGHADGIVTGSMPSDIYYKQGDHVHALISEKPTRRVPGAEGQLTTVDNPSDMQTMPSLTKEQVDRLAAIGKRLEKIYGLPLDIEWSLDRKTGIIYLFQARPTSHNPKVEPSYITPEKIQQLKDIQQVTAVVPASGQAKTLNRDNIIACRTAKEAVDNYLAHPGIEPEAILIAEPSAPNSHEAGFFKKKEIPLIYLPGKYQFVLNKLKHHTLILDTQESFIGAVPAGVDASELISKGLRRHLAPKMESAIFQADPQAIETIIDDLTREAAEFDDKDLKLAFGWNLLDKLLNTFEEAESRPQRAYLLACILRIIEKRLLPKIPENERSEVWHKILSNAQHVWDLSNTNADILGKKFAMNWLRAAILHRPVQNVIASETLYTALDAVKERDLLGLVSPKDKVGKTTEKDIYLDVFQRSQKFILLPAVRESWVSFINHLDLHQMQQLATIFKKLGPQVIEIWINSIFADFWTIELEEKGVEPKDPHVKATECLAELLKLTENPNMKVSLDMHKEALALARQFSGLAPSFKEPSQFDNLFSHLESNLFKKIETCAAMMRKAIGLELTLLTQAFDAMISAWDDCIKGLSESPLYDKGNKQESVLQAQRFVQMLENYYAMLTELMHTCILNKPVENARDEVLREQAGRLNIFLPDLYEELSTKINETTAITLLSPSKNFSVLTAALGSGYLAPRRAEPETLIDFHTMIHQSLIVASQSINTCSGTKIRLPVKLEELSHTLCNQLDTKRGRRPSLQSIVYHYPNMIISFNVPLNLHSAQFVIYAEVNAKGNLISAEFEGRFFPSDILWGGWIPLITLMSYYSRDSQMKKPDNYDVSMLQAQRSLRTMNISKCAKIIHGACI